MASEKLQIPTGHITHMRLQSIATEAIPAYIQASQSQ